MQIGWKLVIETTKGIVSLCSDIQGDSFILSYPLKTEISDEMVMEALDVEYSKKVHSKYELLQENGEMEKLKRWARFYSERLSDDVGRVWIDKGKRGNDNYYVKTIKKKKVKKYICGYMCTNEIWTYRFHLCTPTEPDAPNSKAKYIQPYRDRFIKLLVLIAKQVGEIVAVDLDSDFGPYTPKILLKEGYKVKHWKEEVEYCYAKKGKKEIILEGENYEKPRFWKVLVRFQKTNKLTGEDLIKLLEKFYSSPIYTKHMAEQETFYEKILN